MSLPSDAKERKNIPIVTGVMRYFPLALAEVAKVSLAGNQQHNPGEKLHWAREKSTDHEDCAGRHLMEAGTLDSDGQRHTAKLAWRALAMLQLEIEREQGKPTPNISPYAVVRQMDAEAAARLDRKKRCYLAGPMRGYKYFNFPAFDDAKRCLEYRGLEVVSPADIDRAKGHTDNKGYAERDVKEILTCDMIYLLRGWTKSVGATAEFMIARWIQLEVECQNGSTDPLYDLCHDNIMVIK